MRLLAVTAAAAAILFVPGCMLAGDPSLLAADVSSQAIQNAHADAENLSRMRSIAMIRRFARHGYLVRIPSRTHFYYLHSIPSRYRYCRPWTRLFLTRLSREYHARFGKRLRVTSLVRTVPQQRRLERRNGNAANATGSHRSSHLTGATLDISKRYMTRREKNWMRDTLYALRQRGYIYAIEEFEQPTFHIMIYRNYTEYVARLKRSRRNSRLSAGDTAAKSVEGESPDTD